MHKASVMQDEYVPVISCVNVVPVANSTVLRTYSFVEGGRSLVKCSYSSNNAVA